MTAIFLIFFSILFYQLLIKPALNSTTSPNTTRNEQNEHLMRMWRNLQQFQGKKEEGTQHIKTKQAQAENISNSQTERFGGGEYIDYEEI